ncbi:MAG: CdaR family protein [Treponema sp.]|nr:CdaR family protein [Treponema sp.]
MDARKILIRAVENWPAKVLSIGVAIMLVVFHRMSALEERFFSVPLTIERDGLLVPSSPYPRMVRVNLRGEANSVFSIMESDIEVYVDVERLEEPGVYTVPVQWRKRNAPQGMEPVQITVEPMEITLSLDRRVTRAVPVTANFRGQVEAGHSMTSFSLNPPQVVIEGPQALVSGVSEIFTEVIDIEGRRSNFFVTAAVLNPDPLVIIRGSGTSEFHGNVTEMIPVRNIANVPIVITGLAQGFAAELEPAAANIRLEGGTQAALDGFTPAPEFLSVDGSGVYQPGTYTLRVLALAVEDVSLRVEPEEVVIHVSFAVEEQEYEDVEEEAGGEYIQAGAEDIGEIEEQHEDDAGDENEDEGEDQSEGEEL